MEVFVVGRPANRHRKVAICPLVRVAVGEKVVGVVPEVIWFCTIHRTGLEKYWPEGTSVNGLDEPGSGLSMNRHKKVAAWALFIGLLGENVVGVVPEVIP